MTQETHLSPTDVLGMFDRTLLYVSRRQRSAEEQIHINFDEEYRSVGARSANEFRHLLRTLADRGLLEIPGPIGGRSAQTFQVSLEGWGKAAELSRTQPDSSQAFVAMWFKKALKPAWEEGFEPALRASGFNPIRIDLVQHNDRIDDVIITEIKRSGLLVADFTGNRGGVYFEAGFALGLGITVIWTCKESDIGKVHFDTRQYPHVLWNNPAELKEKLEYRIKATVPLSPK